MDGTMRTLGIILAAGKSTRLYPSTLALTKQLLPVYDKPLIYYPLSTLMLAGIKDFVIISSPEEQSSFIKLFTNFQADLGINITFLTQEVPTGIPDAFNIVYDHFGENIFEYDLHALILGDNIFYGSGFRGLLQESIQKLDRRNAMIYLYSVNDPERFGVAEVNDDGSVISIEEKPDKPKTNLAVTGLYFYPTSVYLYTKTLTPSKRGELEITDLNNQYIQKNQMSSVQLRRGMVWFDTGTAESMLEASNFIYNVQKHQNYLIGSPHEIALDNKWTDAKSIQPFINKCSKTHYGQYLQKLIKD